MHHPSVITRWLFVTAFASGLPLAGCSSPNPAGGGGGGGPIAIDQFYSTLVGAACQALYACPPTASGTIAARLAYTDAATCTARLATAIPPDVRDLLLAVRAGTVRYDGAAVRQCVSQLSSTCNINSTLVNACPGVFTGTVAAGGQCLRSEECTGDSYCQHARSASGVVQCPGVCAPRLAPGATCMSDAQCSGGASGMAGYCTTAPGSSTSATTCFLRRQGTPANGGQPCGPSSMGTTYTYTDCAPGFRCQFSGTVQGTCVATPAAGQPCSTMNSCGDGLICVSDASGAGTCRAAVIHSHAGDPCSAMGADVCNPVYRLTCMGTTCQAVGDGTAGSSCSRSDFGSNVACNPGLYCDSTSHRCTAQQPTGAMCHGSDECVGTCGPAQVCIDRACE